MQANSSTPARREGRGEVSEEEAERWGWRARGNPETGGYIRWGRTPDRKRESAKPYGPRLVVPPEAPFTRPSPLSSAFPSWFLPWFANADTPLNKQYSAGIKKKVRLQCLTKKKIPKSYSSPDRGRDRFRFVLVSQWSGAWLFCRSALIVVSIERLSLFYGGRIRRSGGRC